MNYTSKIFKQCINSDGYIALLLVAPLILVCGCSFRPVNCARSSAGSIPMDKSSILPIMLEAPLSVSENFAVTPVMGFSFGDVTMREFGVSFDKTNMRFPYRYQGDMAPKVYWYYGAGVSLMNFSETGDDAFFASAHCRIGFVFIDKGLFEGAQIRLLNGEDYTLNNQKYNSQSIQLLITFVPRRY